MGSSAEEALQKVTVGPVERLRQPIEIVEYDADWQERYAHEEAVIQEALRSSALLVEHCGSTSVPGLPAKPVIDVLLLVADPSSEADYVPALEGAGYELRIREPDWHEHRMFRRMEPRVNLHVFRTGCDEARRMLAFRDWLRADAEDRQRYAETKRALAAQPWDFMQEYADAKSDVVAEIMERALAADRQDEPAATS